MPTSSLGVAIQRLLADPRPDEAGMTDCELLTRFLGSRDDHALAALVRRHASMVWIVCRRLLNDHDAEDAFQATFLVFVRRAADVPRQAVPNWLYGVARQTAVRLRAMAAKRRRREAQVENLPEPTVPEVRDADLPSVVDEELSRLPDHYRGVIVLCDLDGRTRKEAARQLGIPEGSVASRLARARRMVAKRLTQRDRAFAGGLAATVVSAGSAAAAAPPALVATTINAASLLAAGPAPGVVSASVAALTDGVVRAMFVTRIKSVLAVLLVVATLAGAVGMVYQTQAAEPPKDAPKKAEEKSLPAQPTPPAAKTDRERMVGNWFIMNDDSLRKGEMWVITEDSILMHAKNLGLITRHYAHRLDASKNPKQIDITVSRINGPTVGVIKGIYVLDGDELRLCLGEMGKDRPAVFPERPRPGEVLILQRETPDGAKPRPKGKPSAVTDEARMAQKVLTPEEAIKHRQTEPAIKPREEKVTVKFKVTAVEILRVSKSSLIGANAGTFERLVLKEGDRFAVQLLPPDIMDTIRRLGIDPDKHFTGKVVQVTGLLQPGQPRHGTGQFQIGVSDLTQFEVVGK
jgi:RNA polymerase sigma factor (sigma-70 family)